MGSAGVKAPPQDRSVCPRPAGHAARASAAPQGRGPPALAPAASWAPPRPPRPPLSSQWDSSQVGAILCPCQPSPGSGGSAEPRRLGEQPRFLTASPQFLPQAASEFADWRGHRFAAEPVTSGRARARGRFVPGLSSAPVRPSLSSGPLGRYTRSMSSSLKCLRP